MKELFSVLPRITLTDKCDYLVDTCFFFWAFQNGKEKDFEKLLDKKIVGMTSFNADEVVLKSHRVNERVREKARKVLRKTQKFYVLDVPVRPGDWAGELKFVKDHVPEFSCAEHDPSDAIILAAAICTGADVLTRDKHDLFNVKMENCIKKYRVKVLNKF